MRRLFSLLRTFGGNTAPVTCDKRVSRQYSLPRSLRQIVSGASGVTFSWNRLLESKRDMKTVTQYLLLAFALTSVQISCTESRLNEKRRSKTERRYTHRENICEIVDRDSKIHCYCDDNDLNKASKADCWVFNGGLEKNDSIWANFNAQPHLKKLTFNIRSDGALKFIPLHVIHRLKTLKKLHFHYATLDKIEKGIFTNMTTLTEIVLMNNKITALDFSSFTNLPQLVNLTIKGNTVNEVQRDVFVDLPNLKNLDLSFNNISLAHDGCFEHLPMLNDLILEGNSMTILTSDTFRGLANLTRLDLRSNKLSMIGDLTFTELWSLNELLLDNNELEFLAPRAFDGLVYLRKLSLTGNKLRSINEGLLEGVRGLELLDLRNNMIEFITHETVKPIIDNLKLTTSVLYLSGNKLVCDCRLIWIKILRNETKSEPLRAALDDVMCSRNIEKKENEVLKDNYDDIKVKVNDVFDGRNMLKIGDDDDDDDDNQLFTIEPTAQSLITEEVSVVDLPIEALPCPKQLPQQSNGDSLMLSSENASASRGTFLSIFTTLTLMISVAVIRI